VAFSFTVTVGRDEAESHVYSLTTIKMGKVLEGISSRKQRTWSPHRWSATLV